MSEKEFECFYELDMTDLDEAVCWFSKDKLMLHSFNAIIVSIANYIDLNSIEDLKREMGKRVKKIKRTIITEEIVDVNNT